MTVVNKKRSNKNIHRFTKWGDFNYPYDIYYIRLFVPCQSSYVTRKS